MNKIVNQRLLGVVILCALLGICLTVLLHNNKTQQQVQNISTEPKNPNASLIPEKNPSPLTDTKGMETFPGATDQKNVDPITPQTSGIAPGASVSTIPQNDHGVSSALSHSVFNESPSVNSVKSQNPINTSVQPVTNVPPVLAHPDPVLAPQNEGSNKGQISTVNKANTTNIQPLPTVATATKTATVLPQNPGVTTSVSSTSHSIQQNVAVSEASNKSSVTPVSQKKTVTHQIKPGVTTAISAHKKGMIAHNDAPHFVVQMGLFNSIENATTLSNKLHKAGFTDVTTQEVSTAQGKMIRVVLGGTKGLSRSSAETLRLTLIKNAHVHGFVTPLGSTNLIKHKPNKTLHSSPKKISSSTERENDIVPDNSHLQ